MAVADHDAETAVTGLDWVVIVLTVGLMALYWRCDRLDNPPDPIEPPEPAPGPNNRYHKVTPKRSKR